MNEHDKFLADRLLSENLPITYRTVSRYLGVHVNSAKGILYNFHRKQNALKENSIHATYLVSGKPVAHPNYQANDGELSSSLPEQLYSVETKRVCIVPEARLQDALGSYDEVTSIHVYSLSPHPNIDYAAIVDSTHSASSTSRRDAVLDAPARSLGAIGNEHVRKRNRSSRPALAAPSSSIKLKQAASDPTASKKEVVPIAQGTDTAKVAPHPGKPPPTTSSNRGAAGGILQSFAKAAASQSHSKVASKEKEEKSNAMSDDGEANDSDDMPSKDTRQSDSVKKTRKEREQELRKMMEEDDDDEAEDDASDANMEDAADHELEETNEEAEETVGIQEEDKSASGLKPDNGPSEVVSSAADGRRRGKRRVMKKKRIVDDQGYMVTIQEAGWESFSEDDAQRPPAKRSTPAPTPAPSNAKPKKTVGKGAQGSIMSFFAKK